MVATFLQDDLVEELKLVFKDLRYKTPGGELSEINIFPQALPIPGPAEPPEGESTEYLEEGLGVRWGGNAYHGLFWNAILLI